MKINRGILYGAAAYTFWGLLPIYWKALQIVPAAQILANRMVWSLAFVLVLLAVRRQWAWLSPTLKNRRVVFIYTITALLLSVNWFVYIWAVNAGYVIETSLGYFINPLFNVLLGVLFLKETLRRGQVIALSLAAGGVAYLTFSYGAFPWIAMTLAVTFGVYALIRKVAPLESTQALTLETAVMFLPALAYLLFVQANGTGAFGNIDTRTTLLLAGAGLATGLPLLLFGAAAKRITMTNLGLLQYIAPTLQFLLGVYAYNEPFSRQQLIGFGFIWLALLVYSIEGIRHSRQRHSTAALTEASAPTD
jgi:chloramphenicol-sensitive protein RarD